MTIGFGFINIFHKKSRAQEFTLKLRLENNKPKEPRDTPNLNKNQ